MHRFLGFCGSPQLIPNRRLPLVKERIKAGIPRRGRERVLSGHTILIVEDELLIRLALREHLEACGFSVLEAADAAEAMDLMERHDEIALVFSDVRMPGDMDGIDLAEWILKHWPGLPVMLTSGELGRIKASEELARAENFSAFSKSYRYAEITAKMTLAIEKSAWS
jgi:CheY-like chemotaxis protein